MNHYEGFPARAGIDPYQCRRRVIAVRFPRPCGDRPEANAVFAKGRMVSPPVRG